MLTSADLERLRGAIVEVAILDDAHDPGCAPVALNFSDGSRAMIAYWRLIAVEEAGFSSFDHAQQYGLPRPIDAREELVKVLAGRRCLDARLDRLKRDLEFMFDGDLRLQVFGFTSYEAWQFHFPGGGAAYSNHIRAVE